MSTVNPNDSARVRQNRQDAEAAFSQLPADRDGSPEAIEADIRRTRSNMDSTLNELQSRLMGARHDLVNQFTHNLTEAVIRNPVPAALLGSGLVLVLASTLWRHRVPVVFAGSAIAWRKLYGPEEGRYQRPEYEYEHSPEPTVSYHSDERPGRLKRVGGRASETKRQWGSSLRGAASSSRERLAESGQRLSEKGAQIRGSFSEAADSARSRASHLSHSARERASELSHSARELGQSARERAHRVQHGSQRMLREQPLMLAAAGLAAGALIGALLPRTRREEEMMGPIRDRLIERAREEASEQFEHGKKIAQAAGEAATDAAKESVREELGRQSSGSSDRSADAPTGAASGKPAGDSAPHA